MAKIKLLGAILLVVVTSSMFNNAYAQTLPVQWERCYGGTDHDWAAMAIPAINYGFIVAGSSVSTGGNHVAPLNGGGDFWVIRTDDYGGIIWERSYGGTGYEYASAIIKTSFGYVIGGVTNSSDGEVTGLHGSPFPRSYNDVWIIGIDSSGNLLWENTYGGSYPDQLYSIVPAGGGGYIAAGYTLSTDGDITNYHGRMDAWVIKINDTGALLWQKTIGGANRDNALSIQRTFEGGYILAGNSNSDSTDTTAATVDGWLVKLNDTGGITWQKYFGGTGDDYITNVIQTSDTGYIMTGFSNSHDGDIPVNRGGDDYWVIKLSKTGVKQWSKTYGGTGTDQAQSIIQTYDGGYVVAGSTSSFDSDVVGNNGVYDVWLVKLNDTGGIQWKKTFGGLYADYASSIVQTADSGYIISATTESNEHDVTGNHGSDDYWVFRLDKYGLRIPELSKNKDAVVFPNPASSKLYFEFPELLDQIKIQVFDVAGRILDANVVVAEIKAAVDIHNYAPGVYFYKITSKNKVQCGKFTVAR